MKSRKLIHEFNNKIKNQRRRKWYYSLSVTLAAMVVFVTVYALILPAITSEHPVEPECGFDEHIHTALCRSVSPICEKEESPGHTHTESCYEHTETLICEEDHIHGVECYEISDVLICEIPESAGHTHTDECYNFICGLTEHTHTIDCFPAWKGEVTNVENLINAIPDIDDIQDTIDSFGDDEESFNQYYTNLTTVYACARTAYDALDDRLKPFTVNAARLDEYSWLYTETLAVMQDYISIQYRNYFDMGTTNSQGRFATLFNIPNQTITVRPWWSYVICDQAMTGVYYAKATALNGGTPLDLTVPANGFIIVYHSNYGTGVDGTGFRLNVTAGDWNSANPGDFLIIRGNITDQTVVSTYGGTLSTLRFIKRSSYPSGETYLPKDYKNNTSKLTVVHGADTNQFIELNLYDYSDNINELYDFNHKYPGFQQDTGTTSTTTTSVNTYGLNWGDNVCTDLKAGYSGVTSAGSGGINAPGASGGNGSLRPVVGAMGKTLNGDGYPMLADGTSLGYLFGEKINLYGQIKQYATKLNNNSSINGFFQLDDETGLYYYNSHNNHAQFVAGTGDDDDTFTLYNQVITANHMMYPFGNFLPLNDIVHDSRQASTIDRTYLQSIAASATYKASLGMDDYFATGNNFTSYAAKHPYATLGNALRRFLTNMDNRLGTFNWVAEDATNTYFNLAGVKPDNDQAQTVTFTNSDLQNIYTIDYDVPTNFYFGMEMKMKFVQSRNGKTSKGAEMILRFTGDDDVWIYIDDVLFLDLTGIHRHTGGEIDFVNGVVRYYDFDRRTGDVAMSDNGGIAYKTVTFAQLLSDAGKSTSHLKANGTFEDYSVHTLNFYYMERGAGSGVCRLEFNMEQTAPTGIYKVDQYGAKVAGAEFSLYAADGNYNYLTSLNGTPINSEVASVSPIDGRITFKNGMSVMPLYNGITDENGEMLLVNEKGQFLAAGEIRAMLGDHFILRETKVPEGYRTVSDEIYLYFDEDIILCANVYKSGAWITPNATVRASENLQVANPETLPPSLLQAVGASSTGVINYYEMENGIFTRDAVGTLFAVVLKRNDKSLAENDEWYPVIGDQDAGFHVLSDNTVQGAINAAKTYKSGSKYTHAFEVGELIFNSASGVEIVDTVGMITILKELPGDPTHYYTYLYDRHDRDPEMFDYEKSEYYVAYYYSSASSLDGATPANTVRISSHCEEGNSATQNFTIQWTATIQVPNVVNTLFFQKVNSNESLINNTVFGLYDAVADSTGLGYYVAKRGGNTYYVLLDTDGESAKVFDTSFNLLATGKYNIQSFAFSPSPSSDKGMVTSTGAGIINVTAGGNTYTITPARNSSLGGNQSLVGYTHNACDTVNTDGTGHFNYLKNGNYFLKEILAPSGYELNTSNIKIAVIGEGVYANAGLDTNKVKVGNGLGYIVKSLDTFASVGDISETLSWVYAMLRVHNGTGFIHNLDPFVWTEYAVDDIDEGWTNVSTGFTHTPNHDPYDTDAEDKPMVIYMIYDGAASKINIDEIITGYPLFDYTHYDRTDAPESIPGSPATILWATHGWSDLAIFQDTPYGLLNTSPYTDYIPVTETVDGIEVPYDISPLFSSPTFVRVTDDRLIDLTIEKVDMSNETTKLSGAGFVVYRMAGDEKEYYSYNTATSKAVWRKLAGTETPSDYMLTTDTNGRISLRGMTNGQYMLEELVAPAGYDRFKHTIGFTVSGDKITWVNDNTYCTITGSDFKILRVRDTTGFRLPNTGGIGVKKIKTIGLIFVILPAPIFFIYRKKNKKIK